MVLMLLAILMISLHTALTTLSILRSDSKTENDYLVGAEDGCCGFLAIAVSFVAVDRDASEVKGKAAKRRILSRLLTVGIQIPILVVTIAGLGIISGPQAWDYQKTSVFVFVIVLMLHLINLIENLYELGISSML